MAAKRGAALLMACLGLCQAQNVILLNFLSRPDIRAPFLYVEIYNQSLAAPGYIFMTPTSATTTNFQYGPYIYSSQGELVWTGYSLLQPGLVGFNEQVCSYNGSPHISLTQFAGAVGGGPGTRSFSQLIDATYTSVVAMSPQGVVDGQQVTQDLHEFNVLGTDGATALATTYINVQHPVVYSKCTGSPATTWTKSGVFTEFSTDGLNTTIFQWNALDWVDPTDTYVCPNEPGVGNGTTADNGFDFFHINSLDKDEHGDYLVSGRHVSTVYKIAGLNNPDGLKPGSIIWRLGGLRTDFPIIDSIVPGVPGLNFSFQHHARFEPSINGISLWDNADRPLTSAPPPHASSGISIAISTLNGVKRATLIGQFISPGGQLTASQGSHQFLPNGNHFMGMGNVPFLYEQTPSGQTVLYANWGPLPLGSYRAFKYPWNGNPLIQEIALFSYAQNCSAPAAFYSSWNGATSIETWKYFTSDSETGTFALAATAASNGAFETFATGTFNLYAYAIAYDNSGTVLGQTPTVKTFVPDAALAPFCNAFFCPRGTVYSSAAQSSCSGSQPTTSDSLSTTVSNFNSSLAANTTMTIPAAGPQSTPILNLTTTNFPPPASSAPETFATMVATPVRKGLKPIPISFSSSINVPQTSTL